MPVVSQPGDEAEGEGGGGGDGNQGGGGEELEAAVIEATAGLVGAEVTEEGGDDEKRGTGEGAGLQKSAIGADLIPAAAELTAELLIELQEGKVLVHFSDGVSRFILVGVVFDEAALDRASVVGDQLGRQVAIELL